MQNLKLNDLRGAYEINSDEELNLLYWAYMFNLQHNVDSVFEQNLAKETSIILSNDFHADINTVVTSLIYKTATKINCSDEDIKTIFNEDIMNKVRLLRKFSDNMSSTNMDKEWMINTIIYDVKTTIIKLVERVSLLHNISEQEFMDNNLLDDTLGFYVPLAQLLGIYKIKNNLEDLCFRYDPNYEITSKIVKKACERNSEIIKCVNDAFEKSSLDFKDDVEFRLNKKSNYDIYLKANIISENVDIFNNESNFKISGFCSIKCLTKTKKECYEMLSFIHSFKYQFGSFCDYISGMQGDEYQAIHTNVFINSHLVDFRICTHEMSAVNLYGITHNWATNPDLQERLVDKYDFYQELFELISGDLNADFVKLFKEQIINKRVDVSDYKALEKQKNLK